MAVLSLVQHLGHDKFEPWSGIARLLGTIRKSLDATFHHLVGLLAFLAKLEGHFAAKFHLGRASKGHFTSHLVVTKGVGFQQLHLGHHVFGRQKEVLLGENFHELFLQRGCNIGHHFLRGEGRGKVLAHTGFTFHVTLVALHGTLATSSLFLAKFKFLGLFWIGQRVLAEKKIKQPRVSGAAHICRTVIHLILRTYLGEIQSFIAFAKIGAGADRQQSKRENGSQRDLHGERLFYGLGGHNGGWMIFYTLCVSTRKDLFCG
mmetsp:Transcript_18599/g.43352  ORF Transcript_18599/g.43352 Transcript_18599/m.43352 type:complete len:261 (+) Transcript_18599:250-1032(+)